MLLTRFSVSEPLHSVLLPKDPSQPMLLATLVCPLGTSRTSGLEQVDPCGPEGLAHTETSPALFAYRQGLSSSKCNFGVCTAAGPHVWSECIHLSIASQVKERKGILFPKAHGNGFCLDVGPGVLCRLPLPP